MDFNRKKGDSSTAVAAQLTLVFVVLKLAEQITWPWLWVLTPLWLYAGITFGAGFIGGFIKVLRARRSKTLRH